MSFSRIMPGGFGVGAKVTSSQFNQLDVDHANALDKSAAGDTIAGAIGFTGAGQIDANQAGAIQVQVASGVQVTFTGGIVTTTPFGIALHGGTTDEILYQNARTKVVMNPAIALNGVLASGWTASTGSLVGPATGTVQGIGPFVGHQGATLTNVRMFINVHSGHAALPAVMPELQVKRTNITTNTGATIGDTFASAANAGAWQSTTFWDIPVSDAAVDRTQNVYWLLLVDENGSNSVAGNAYTGFQLTFTNITNMQFA